jgi:hypothetical protein
VLYMQRRRVVMDMEICNVVDCINLLLLLAVIALLHLTQRSCFGDASLPRAYGAVSTRQPTMKYVFHGRDVRKWAAASNPAGVYHR